MFIGSLLLAMGSMTAFAQAGAGPLKIGIIDAAQFQDDKAGITKWLNAERALAIEFQPAQNELNVMRTKLEGLDKELAALREAQERGTPPVDPKAVKAKEEEFTKLYNEYQAKGQQLEERVQQRRAAVVNPIVQEIRTALGDFAKQRGYSVMISREAVIALADEKLDVTKDFITYFNARPAAPAPPANPR